MTSTASPLQFRDVTRGRALLAQLHRNVEAAGRELTVMHVCGSHEQALARYGMRQSLPPDLRVQMGPGCPVCVTDAPEIDAVITLAEAGIPVLTYGDMLRVPGSRGSLDDARAAGARVEVIYSALQALEHAARAREPVVFFATGFETTAVATAALLLRSPPKNLFVYSAHKWVPAAMEVVAQSPGSRIEGYLAAGHAATITGWGLFEEFVDRYQVPVVVAGFEPLDILSGLVALCAQVAEGRSEVVNAFTRCVTKEGNRRALAALAQVFETKAGKWRGIAEVPGGELQLREEFRPWDAALRFEDLLAGAPCRRPTSLAEECRCGAIMTGQADPPDCLHFDRACRPESPVGACMVSTEGPCRIWLQHGITAPRPTRSRTP